jgi:hypothetical protein
MIAQYDYAVEKRIPVLGFVRGNLGDIPFDTTEKLDKNRKRLNLFRQKVLSKTCCKYSNPTELGMAVMKSLMAEARIRPRTGWVRADQARSDTDVQRERKLIEELEDGKALIEELEREIRDRAILGDEVPQGLFAQGNDTCEITITYTNPDKRHVKEDVKLTWDEIFKIIGPSIYGYIPAEAERRVYGETDVSVPGQFRRTHQD